MATDLLLTVTFFATLLGFGVIVTSLTKRINVPNALFLMLVGLLFGPTVLGMVDVSKMGDIPDFLRTLALIIIVFAGSFHLKMETFKRLSRISMKLSFGCFFFTTISMGLLAHYMFGITLLGSMILGSIIAGTSSAAISTFKKMFEKDEKVSDILTIESIFNDPMTVLVPLILLDAYILRGTLTSTMFINQFWLMIAAGVGTGVVVGLAAAEVFKRTQKELSPILSFAIALITYALASNVGGSGILAVAICAIILGNLEIPYKKIIGEFEDTMSLTLTIAVFTLLGAQIFLTITPALLMAELMFIAILIFLIRPLFTMLFLYRDELSLEDKFIIAFTAPRGVAAAAMAAIPLTYVLREGIESLVVEGQIILLTTFLVILLTLLSSTITGILVFKLNKKQEYEESRKKPQKETLVEPDLNQLP